MFGRELVNFLFSTGPLFCSGHSDFVSVCVHHIELNLNFRFKMTVKRKSKLKEVSGKSNENGGSPMDDHEEDSMGVSFLQRTIYNPMLEGVRWTERYSDSIEKFWLKLPDFVTTFIATLAVFTFGSTLRGKSYLLSIFLFYLYRIHLMFPF